MAKKRYVEVVAGIVENEEGEILINERPPGSYYELYWEFPGGKIEKEDHRHQFITLKREWMEEFGVVVRLTKFLGSFEHDYGWNNGKVCKIHFYRCVIVEGVPESRINSKFTWVKPQKLPEYKEKFLPSNLHLFPILLP